MNFVNRFLNQQLGVSTCRNHDVVMSRLINKRSEEFKWVYSGASLDSSLVTPVFACKFAAVKGYEHLLALANEDGRIALQNIDGGGLQSAGVSHRNAIFDLVWMPTRMKLLTACGDHSAALYNFRGGSLETERVFRGHTRSVKTISCRVDDNCTFATGGRDGRIIIWDCRSAKSDVLYCKPDISLSYVHCRLPYHVLKHSSKKVYASVTGSSSVTGLVFQDYYTLVSCGADDGLIKLWDLRKNYCFADRAAIPKNALPYAGKTSRRGFSGLLLNSSGTKLYANCLDNVIYCYNIGTVNPEPVMHYYGHKNSTFYVKSTLSSDERYLFSGSSDNNAYIWNTDFSEPIVRLEGHEAEVTCVAWCSNDTALVTCSDDLRHKIWRIGPEVVTNDMMTRLYSSSATTKISNSNDVRHLPKQALECNEYDDINLVKPSKFNYTCYSRIYKDELENESENRNIYAGFIKMGNKRRRILKLMNNSKRRADSEDEDQSIYTIKRLKMYCDSTFTESEDSDSPTSSLPNFVVDGSAPHLNTSPIKKKENDWLTKLRLERMSIKEIQELSKPTSSKLPKIDCKSPSQKTTATPNNKLQNSNGRSTQTPLLRYFKLTNNSNSQQYADKPPTAITSKDQLVKEN